MVQCEMCGAETASPKTIKVEGAELQVCDNCSQFGTEVRDQTSSSSGSTKYSTSSSSGGSSDSGGKSGSSGGKKKRRRRRDMFDEMDELAADYDQRIRAAREAAGISQEDLAKKLNEKASLIRKIEHGDVLPSDSVQKKLESELDIALTESAGGEDEEWEGGESGSGLTLGDMVKRKD